MSTTIQQCVRAGMTVSEARTAINEGWSAEQFSDFLRSKDERILARQLRDRRRINDYIARLNEGWSGGLL